MGYLVLAYLSMAILAAGVFVAGKTVLGMATRGLDLIERTVALKEQRGKSLTPPTIPPDLFNRIMKWGDQSAQEFERKAILDLYYDFADDPHPWDRVRAALPRLPEEQMSTDAMFMQ